MSIIVSNISKSYTRTAPSELALDQISFEIKEGEIVGFLGPNGAGKSTLMKILTTYLAPSQGTAIINGYDIHTQPIEVRKSIGYLPEHNPLYLEMYVREYLFLNRKIYGSPQSSVETVIALTGLTPEANKKIHQLSKGYRQRLGLACALLHDPKVLILDEPTTGLDPNQLAQIRGLIKTIGKSKIVFLSTHVLQEVEALCDRVIIINKGRLVTDQKLSELEKASKQTIQVEFDYRVEDAFLLKLPHATQVKNTHGFVYEITFDTTQDMRPVVFDFAHDHQLKTLQLSRQHKNLEALFRELTA